MNDLEDYFEKNDKRQINKWSHYFEIYETFFAKYRNQKVRILEIGVFQGGSLQMWKHYFGNNAEIYAIDIEPRCKEFEEEGIKIFIGSQSDRNFLEEIKKELPPLDIIIDDGGHTMNQQKISFEILFDSVKSDGIYLVEDTHTSYWIDYGGGKKRNGTFIEFAKSLIDDLNAEHSQQKRFNETKYTRAIKGIYFYDSVVVFEKKLKKKLEVKMTGKPSYIYKEPYYTKVTKAKRKFEQLLQFLRIKQLLFPKD
ncbi:class I SAM-dependent methyltransferase [Paraflavitalea sp. sgz302555]|uniref:class I SAM-dependent methyltransferase n=1 Tax=Paraflavitalea sp. sgz302555 TaxID=3424849 RepID=UPI003D339F3B